MNTNSRLRRLPGDAVPLSCDAAIAAILGVVIVLALWAFGLFDRTPDETLGPRISAGTHTYYLPPPDDVTVNGVPIKTTIYGPFSEPSFSGDVPEDAPVVEPPPSGWYTMLRRVVHADELAAEIDRDPTVVRRAFFEVSPDDPERLSTGGECRTLYTIDGPTSMPICAAPNLLVEEVRFTPDETGGRT